MIISNKQIMQLLQIAQDAKQLAVSNGRNWDSYVRCVAQLIDEINTQQSKTLRNIDELD